MQEEFSAVIELVDEVMAELETLESETDDRKRTAASILGNLSNFIGSGLGDLKDKVDELKDQLEKLRDKAIELQNE